MQLSSAWRPATAAASAKRRSGPALPGRETRVRSQRIPAVRPVKKSRAVSKSSAMARAVVERLADHRPDHPDPVVVSEAHVELATPRSRTAAASAAPRVLDRTSCLPPRPRRVSASALRDVPDDEDLGGPALDRDGRRARALAERARPRAPPPPAARRSAAMPDRRRAVSSLAGSDARPAAEDRVRAARGPRCRTSTVAESRCVRRRVVGGDVEGLAARRRRAARPSNVTATSVRRRRGQALPGELGAARDAPSRPAGGGSGAPPAAAGGSATAAPGRSPVPSASSARATSSCGARSRPKSTDVRPGRARRAAPAGVPSSSNSTEATVASRDDGDGLRRRRRGPGRESRRRSWRGDGRTRLPEASGRRDRHRRRVAGLAMRRRAAWREARGGRGGGGLLPGLPLGVLGRPDDPVGERRRRLVHAVGEHFRELVRVDLVDRVADVWELPTRGS